MVSCLKYGISLQIVKRTEGRFRNSKIPRCVNVYPHVTEMRFVYGFIQWCMEQKVLIRFVIRFQIVSLAYRPLDVLINY
jgi:hypothetical protein